MCGIFGIVDRRSSDRPSAAHLAESARRLRHRGPDANGTYAEPGIGFAHTRLSFLDVDARSNQPFWDAGGRYCLLYNGEIYNFRELRAELEEDGVRFRTTGDTEVLLELLVRSEPEAALRRLEGMFAFALFDSVDKSLLLARDRFGMKPLYVYEDGDLFLFASEIKAMRPWLDLDLDRFSMSAYLLGFGGPTKGFTFYRNLQSVEPGGVVRYAPERPARKSRFFSLPDFWDRDAIESLQRLAPREVVDRVDELLSASVQKHMFADVSVGAFCSGGVDSSLLMAMAARTYDDLAIFHANVKGQWSERAAAEALSRHLGLELKSVDVVDQDFVDMIPRVVSHYEHPFTYHPNCAPLMMVSLLARDSGVKGLLSGEGSDECFLGYPWLGRRRLVDAYHAAGRRLRALVHAIPEVGKILWPDEGDSHQVVRSLLNRREIRDDEVLTRDRVASMPPGSVPAQNVWSVDYMHYHLRTLLHRNDSMGMAASIEARFPFLDHPVVATAVNMPASYKLRFSPTALGKAHPFVRDKWVVRAVADRYVPRSLSRRTKLGFWTTVFKRIDVAPAYYRDSFVQDLFRLTESQMKRTLDEADQALRVRLLHIDAWGRCCVREEPHEPIVEALRTHVTISPE